MNIKPPANTPSHSRQNSKSLQKRKSFKPTLHFQKLVIMYHWSLVINKLQRIMLVRCRQPLRDMCLQLISTARSTDFKSEKIIQHKYTKHVRYTSDEVPKKYKKQFFQNEEYFDSQKLMTDSNTRTQQCINNSSVKQLLSERNTSGSHSQTMDAETPCRLDNHQINEEFLALFDKNTKSSNFGVLSPSKQLEQVELIRKINESYPQQPKPDLDNFLELIKKPEVKRIKRNSEVHQYQSDFSQLYFVLLLPFLIIGFIKILF